MKFPLMVAFSSWVENSGKEIGVKGIPSLVSRVTGHEARVTGYEQIAWVSFLR
jgi:hypothetical protein